jgi:hypothetical protein
MAPFRGLPHTTSSTGGADWDLRPLFLNKSALLSTGIGVKPSDIIAVFEFTGFVLLGLDNATVQNEQHDITPARLFSDYLDHGLGLLSLSNEVDHFNKLDPLLKLPFFEVNEYLHPMPGKRAVSQTFFVIRQRSAFYAA